MRLPLATAAAAVLAFGLAGTGLSVGLPVGAGLSGLTGPSGPDGLSGDAVLGTVGLYECPDDDADDAGARCGTVPVPLDYRSGAGTLGIGLEWYAAPGDAVGTVVAVAGGPGGSSTKDRDGFLDLFYQLEGWNLLLVDLRGTGTSGALHCDRLERFFTSDDEDYVAAVGDCGRELDRTWRRNGERFLPGSELFTTANAARDLDRVLDRLELGQIDLYGVSYGSYFASTFAARYPHRVRSLTLDSSYQIVDLDPWRVTAVTTSRTAFDQVCTRSAACAAAAPGSSWTRIGRLAQRLRSDPVDGDVPVPDGDVPVTVDIGALVTLVNAAGGDPIVYRELDAAARALLEHDDAVPLLRLASVAAGFGGDEDISHFSTSLYSAVVCSDYPQLFDPRAGRGTRERQLDDAIAARAERTFAPFTVDEWFSYSGESYVDCLHWPAPDNDDLPLPDRQSLAAAGVPTLVLSGDLDTITPAVDGRRVAAQLGRSARWVRVHNAVHGTALWDIHDCAGRLVREFVRQPAGLPTMDTSCASRLPEIRAVASFPPRLADAEPSTAAAGGTTDRTALQLAAVAAATVGDAIEQYWYVLDEEVGLRGGRVEITDSEVVRFRFRQTRFVSDARMDGTATWDPVDGAVSAEVTITGPDRIAGRFEISWSHHQPHAVATVVGTVGELVVRATMPAP
ncbi:MAG: alpha/beta hydrolase [Sporichthyaceae bacterium]|nr:alpha/beta hydrolase [Sporichthyaceae bacterium]